MKNYIKKNSLPMILSIFSIVLFTSAVAAHDTFSNKRGNGGQFNNGIRAMKQLDLNDEQRAQLKELLGQRKETATLARSQRNEVRDLIDAGDVNTAAEIAATLARERVTTMAEKQMAIEAILTPEQLEELNSLQAERQLKREQRAERRTARRESSDNA